MELRQLLEAHKGNIALIIGNGINRYNDTGTNSWVDLLKKLADEYMAVDANAIGWDEILKEITYTEFYDLLELHAKRALSSRRPQSATAEQRLQAQFCQLMETWTPRAHHEQIVGWARRNRAPILTTNFDQLLYRAGACDLLHTNTKGFTPYYPWWSYYGDKATKITDPADGFGIWHVNGMHRYHQSVRLGLVHYMGSVGKAKEIIRGKNGSHRLYGQRDAELWGGAATWLHIIFNKPLLIFGLGLETNEVFLRWLLIERARYLYHVHGRLPDQASPSAWYAEVPSVKNPDQGKGKRYFLESVGIKYVAVGSYDELYGPGTWE